MSQSSSSSASSSGANEFSSSLYMDASADAVTDFVADIKNMPKYMPTTKKAEDAGEHRVRVAGGGDGFQYDSEGYLRRNKDDGHLEWGSDEKTYRGSMEIDPDGDGSNVTIKLVFSGDKYKDIPADRVNEGLRTALESIKNHVEGTGGKVKPSVEN